MTDKPESEPPPEPVAEPASAPATGGENPFRTPAEPEPGPTFGLATVFLYIGLIAVCLGLMRLNVGVGIGFLVLATPALARSFVVVRRRRQSNLPVDWTGKVVAFISSFALMVVVAVASGAAFYGTCWVGFLAIASIADQGNGYDGLIAGFWVGIILGGIVALVAGGVLIRLTWPRKPTRDADKGQA